MNNFPMATNQPILVPATARQDVWSFVSRHHPRLIDDVARLVAGQPTSPRHDKPKCQLCNCNQCPSPINYLVNAADPRSFPHGLTSSGKLLPAGYLLAGSGTCLSGLLPSTPVFNGCNFDLLADLAKQKNGPGLGAASADQLRGFGLGGQAGLAILLGPWADFCLWCWSEHEDSKRDPTLIFGKDNSPFSEETVLSGHDWGVEQVIDTARIKGAKDKSTQRLFGAIAEKASKKGKSLVEYVGEERILVCNAWPWFRCGQEASGDYGIHKDVSNVPEVRRYLTTLLICLNPRKSILLGSWAADCSKKQVAPVPRAPISSLVGSLPHAVFPHPSSSKAKDAWGWPDFESSFIGELP